AVDAPAFGRFYVDVATGAVRQTEVSLNSKSLNIRSNVKYVEDPGLKLWLPSEMVQQFDVSGAGSGGVSDMGGGAGLSAHQTLEARSNFSKFRQVTVEQK